ncbi:MAG: hypothetical protein Q8O92_15280 [Candidatus Latescibacter sp.]|nr:hypothetical protein [Candidatus Latescibacter sp.]
MDLLEEMIVNQAQIDDSRLRSIFRAVERDVDIDLAGEYRIEEWLGDVILRFERSRHLSPEQKQKYYDCVQNMFLEMRESSKRKPVAEVTREHEVVLNELRTALASDKVENAVRIVDELERTLSKRDRNQDPIVGILHVYRRMFRRSPITFLVATLIGIIIYVLLYLFFIFLLK